MPVAARCKAWVCGRLLAGIVGSNSAGWINLSLSLSLSLSGECFVSSGRGLCVGPIPSPEESY